MKTPIRLASVVGLFFALQSFVPQSAAGYTPTKEYKEQKIAEFTVLVHPDCYKQPGKTAATSLERMRIKLQELNRLIPKKQLAAMQKVRIWVEWDNPDSNACYHPNIDWLKENRYNPDKVKCVEIPMKGDLTQDLLFRDQPLVLVHELTHAYHDQVLGFDNADVKAAFRQAKERKLYNKIERVYFGVYEKPQLGYAIKDETEYLAELTEAYFGVNDWFPFTWQDLQRHDPVGWKLMEKVWGPVERKEIKVDMTVVNQTDKTATLFWIKPDGSFQEYDTVKPGAQVVRPTFSGHAWQLRLGKGKAAESRYFYVVPEKNATWTVK